MPDRDAAGVGADTLPKGAQCADPVPAAPIGERLPISDAGATDAGPTFVDISNISLRYGDDRDSLLALHGTTLSIGRGAFAAVVGPSGCGKSTLLKLLSGLRRPSAGKVIVDGHEVTKPLGCVGMAFQNPNLLPWRTTLDNILLPLEIVRPHRTRMRDREARDAYIEQAVRLLHDVGLKGTERTFPWQLSGGMQQRVSLCRALIHRPELLLLDEPFGALDAFTREELWDVLQALWTEQHFTVLLVTHDLNEAVYLSDSVHVMSARPGQITFRLDVDLPRSRTAEMRFTPRFTDCVYTLRSHVRQGRDPAGAVNR